jgi:antitoxin MazE
MLLAGVVTVVALSRVERKARRERVAQILFEIYNYNVYQGGLMKVSKWGNSLAVRLPTAVVDALDLKEGDQIEIRIARERVFEVSRDQSKPHALARLRKLRRALPPGFVFDREEANAR